MKLLGVKASLSAFRWDFVYLLAQLKTDERPGIAALAPPVQLAMEEAEARRTAFEQAQTAAIAAAALVDKRDQGRDRLILEMGGVARATARETYEQMFAKLSPSKTVRLGIDAESVEVQRLLGELKKLDPAHPLRAGYETSLLEAQTALAEAKTQDDAAEVTLALERSNMWRYKMNADKLRVETHGKLVALLGDKAEADAFFRPTQQSPGQTKESPEATTGE